MAPSRMSKALAILCVAWILAGSLLCGCARSITQGAGLAQAGVEYSRAMITLVEVTVDRVIEDDSETLLHQQRLTSYADKEREREELRRFLREHNESVLTLIDPLVRLQHHTRTLHAYFLNLQALAETDAPTRAARAVEELSESINRANADMGKREGVTINQEQKRALAELAHAVTRGVKAAQLRNALKRDAAVIGEQLILHEKVLGQVSDILTHSFDKKIVLLEKKDVDRPYITKSISNQDKWTDARKKVLTAKFFHQGLDNAVAAARQMQIVWEGLVAGREDLGSIQLLLDDIKEFALLTQQLRRAAESKGGSDG